MATMWPGRVARGRCCGMGIYVPDRNGDADRQPGEL
jgi:hypothetical protein